VSTLTKFRSSDTSETTRVIPFDCRTCGACCAYSREWPRFTLESDEDIARLPAQFRDDRHGRMLCSGERCNALFGEIGVATRCMIYAERPLVCHDCQPGDDACIIARQHFGLS
jgi:Fe-S-cluster containining protein